MPDVRCTTFTVRKWEDSASEYPKAPQSSAEPGSLVVVVWMPRSNTARQRAVSLSEYRWNRKSCRVPNRVAKCHQDLVNLMRGAAIVRNADRRSLCGRSELLAHALDRRQALVITSGTGNGTGNGTGKQGGNQEEISVKPTRNTWYVSSLNHKKRKDINNIYEYRTK